MKTLRDEAADVYTELALRYRKSQDPIDLQSMILIEKLVKRIPKSEKRPIDNEKARAKSESEILDFLLSELSYDEESAKASAEYLWNHWNESGWVNGGRKIRDWKLTAKKWNACGILPKYPDGPRKKTKRSTSEEDHDGGF